LKDKPVQNDVIYSSEELVTFDEMNDRKVRGKYKCTQEFFDDYIELFSIKKNDIKINISLKFFEKGSDPRGDELFQEAVKSIFFINEKFYALLKTEFIVSRDYLGKILSVFENYLNDPKEDLRWLLDIYVPSVYKFVLRQFSIASVMAVPAGLRLGYIYNKGDNYAGHQKLIYSDIDYLKYFQEQINFRILRDFNLLSVWQWFSSRRVVFSGKANSSLDKALSYFSHVFSSDAVNSSQSDLLWSVAGIEAVLGESERGIERQIRDKLQAVLPALYSKNIDGYINRMYQQRSKVIHGKVGLETSLADLNYKQLINPVLRRGGNKESDEMREASQIAKLILVFLLQFLFDNTKEDIKFQTVHIP
jgi:hypothetical protein